MMRMQQVDVNGRRERSLARRVRLARFLVVAQMVVRIYGGYKWIQLSGRFFFRKNLAARYARHHR
ncbi:MAG: hypothetical protein AB1671_25330, partial [Thermodesulfobacteriota bacterium]